MIPAPDQATASSASASTRTLAALVACVALVFLFGCFEASTTSNAYSFAWDWFEYQYRQQGAGALAYPVGSRTGDPEVDAALEIRDMKEKAQKADEWAASAGNAARTGHPEEALGYVDRSIKLRPGDWRYRYQAAAYSWVLGDEKEAERQTRLADDDASRAGADPVAVATDIIEAYDDTYDYVQANADRDTRVRVTSTLAEQYERRGDAYMNAGRTAEALDDYAKAEEYRKILGEL